MEKGADRRGTSTGKRKKAMHPTDLTEEQTLVKTRLD
jgi:hypothetical protein